MPRIDVEIIFVDSVPDEIVITGTGLTKNKFLEMWVDGVVWDWWKTDSQNGDLDNGSTIPTPLKAFFLNMKMFSFEVPVFPTDGFIGRVGVDGSVIELRWET